MRVCVCVCVCVCRGAHLIHDLELGQVNRILLYSVDQVGQVRLFLLQLLVHIVRNLRVQEFVRANV